MCLASVGTSTFMGCSLKSLLVMALRVDEAVVYRYAKAFEDVVTSGKSHEAI